MRATSRVMVLCGALAFVAAAGTAEDKPAPNPEELIKAMTEAGKPGPEHAKLAPLIGNWTYTSKFWMDPSKPAMESKGTIERKWVLGKRFVEEKFEGTQFDGKPGFEGFALIGYDNARKQYTYTWNCNMGTGTSNGLGTADAAGKKLTLETESFCPLEKKVIKGREEIRIEGEDKVVQESYMTVDGKEMKVMELIAVRKK